LGRYAHARLLLRQHQPQAALDTLDVLLAEVGNHPLADEACFLRARALREARQTEAALAALREFPLIHPESYLADQSLFLAAEIQEEEQSDVDGAIKTYTQLLADYPGSLFAQEARVRIRRLRGDTL
ncbi:MAG: tetratricopeptide repeat protein, partial [Rhodothermales bacterium]